MYTLPAGKYFVGDPCYVFSNERNNKDRWSELLNISDFFEKPYVEFEGHKLFATPTAWGDGGYYDQFGNEYSVDAGLIGAVPFALWDISEDEQKELNRLGKVVEFNSEFGCCAYDNNSGFNKNRNRFIVVGNYEIDTDPEPEDDYFDEEDDE